jgi:hypothetical protein
MWDGRNLVGEEDKKRSEFGVVKEISDDNMDIIVESLPLHSPHPGLIHPVAKYTVKCCQDCPWGAWLWALGEETSKIRKPPKTPSFVHIFNFGGHFT